MSLLALSVLCLSGFVCAFKGIDREGDVLLFGGTATATISACVLLWWLLEWMGS
jgi:hypothetical protein